ncbi:MAG: hypothetical protein KAT34_17055, partial [Candidatus Aminicenantes bacterium]|nr:hypothetical protein [Candidatus Aminicenantes bacterium]
VESIFAKTPRTLKSNISLESAYKYKTAFEKTGALCKLEEMEEPKPEPQPEIEKIPALQPTPPPKKIAFSPKQIPPTPDPIPPTREAAPPTMKPEAPAPPQTTPPLELSPFTPDPPPALDPDLPEDDIPPLELDFPEEKTQPKAGSIPAGQRTAAAPGVTPQIKIPEIERESPLKRLLPLILVLAVLVVVIVLVFKPGSTPSTENEPSGTTVARETPKTREATLPETPGILSAQVETFTDPNGFYSISLPEGFTKIDESTWDTSKITFSYPERISVSITARAIQGDWNAEKEMKKKVKGIEGGTAGTLSLYRVTGYKVLTLTDAQGYDLTLERTGILSHYYYMVDPGKHAVSIILITEGADRREKHDYLVKTIEESLEIY